MNGSPHRAPRTACLLGPAPATDLTVDVRRTGSLPVMVVTGELDMYGAPLLTAVLEHVAAVDGGPVEVDLTGVPFADTHGLRPLLASDVTIVAASPGVRRLLGALGAAVPRCGPTVTASRHELRTRSGAARRRRA